MNTPSRQFELNCMLNEKYSEDLILGYYKVRYKEELIKYVDF
jgi:hypothetical protein